jgi:ATP-binding cassette, subfamily F, member 3
MAPPVPLLSARGVTKSFGGRRILSGLDLEVADGARIGLVGPNGSGKSTLLRILAGREHADAGNVTARRGLVTAFLPQLVDGEERDALTIVRAARPELAELDAQLAACERELADPALQVDMDRMARVLARQQRLLARFEELGGPRAEGDALRHLRALGLSDEEQRVATRVLSGGQRKLVALAACLAREPDVLLLDEPESHLDIRRRSALEDLIGDFEGAVVAVSHDRWLLDETVGAIAELEGGAVRMWRGNYSAYALEKRVALERQQVVYTTQQKEIARMEEAIRRFKDWAHRVVDERHIKRARNMQRRIDAMDKVERPVFERRKMALALRSGVRGGERVLELEDVDVAFGEEPVLLDVDLTIMRGERVGVVGANGAGKSVLLGLVTGRLAPAAGRRWTGPTIHFGYLSQTAAELDPERSPLEHVRAARAFSEEEAVRRLMAFLFDYEQIRRAVATLSGGERTRLAFLLLMLGEANCLVLDEPTNHLDIDSIEVLEDALERFDGTVVAASHDRYFLERIADRIVEVADGAVRSHEGGYERWAEGRSVPDRSLR